MNDLGTRQRKPSYKAQQAQNARTSSPVDGRRRKRKACEDKDDDWEWTASKRERKEQVVESEEELEDGRREQDVKNNKAVYEEYQSWIRGLERERDDDARERARYIREIRSKCLQLGWPIVIRFERVVLKKAWVEKMEGVDGGPFSRERERLKEKRREVEEAERKNAAEAEESEEDPDVPEIVRKEDSEKGAGAQEKQVQSKEVQTGERCKKEEKKRKHIGGKRYALIEYNHFHHNTECRANGI